MKANLLLLNLYKMALVLFWQRDAGAKQTLLRREKEGLM